MPGPHPRLIKSDSLWETPRLQYFLKLSRGSQCEAKTENHCIEVIVLITFQLFSASTVLLSKLLYFLFIFSLFYFVLSVDNSTISH